AQSPAQPLDGSAKEGRWLAEGRARDSLERDSSERPFRERDRLDFDRHVNSSSSARQRSRDPSAQRGGRDSSLGPASLTQARELHAAGRLQDAYAAYRKLLEADGSSAEVLRGLCACLLDAGQGKLALEVARRLQALRPTECEANLFLAEALLAAGQPADLAESHLQAAAAAQPSSSAARVRLLCASAKAALATEDFKKAMLNASEAVRLASSDAKALLVLADVRIRVADYDSALRTLAAATEALRSAELSRTPASRPLLAMAHGLAARAQERLRKYPEAIEEARRAIEMDPSVGIAHLARASAMQQSGRSAEAEADLQELLRRNPADAEAWVLLGYLQLSSGDQRAVATLQEAVSRSSLPTSSPSIAGAAFVYLGLALDGDRGEGPQAASLVLKGLAKHRNLECV
ncbi:unnamed protein product, partial [Polarella glacialis]